MASSSIEMDTTPVIAVVEISGEREVRSKRKNEETLSPGRSKERKVEPMTELLTDEMIISELGGAALFIIYCLQELGLEPGEHATRPLSVLIQHILKCAKTPELYVAASKIQARHVGDTQVNPLYISGLKRKYIVNNKLVVD